jgi:cobalt/nickel transport system ATP-binding protein
VEEVFAQPELLASVRLDVPVLPRLIRSLRDDGIPVRMAYTYTQAQQALREAYGKKP